MLVLIDTPLMPLLLMLILRQFQALPAFEH
jgi:hypothetical protein